MIQIIEGNETHIPFITHIAEKSWTATYATILSPDQMRFMLDTIYGATELLNVMKTGSQRFLLIKDNHGYQGFASFGPREEDFQVFKLHKLYVLSENHGKGYGTLLINEVKQRLKDQGIKTLDLNVNRHNPAQFFYKKIGFKIIRQEDVPIGEYWMNDYVMRLTILD